MSQPPNQNPSSNPFNWHPYNFTNTTNNSASYGSNYNPNVINTSITGFPFGPYGQINQGPVPWQANSPDSHETQFSKWEFSGDEIVGLRSWKLHNEFLFPVHAGDNKPWTSGINVAEHNDWGWILKERNTTTEGGTVELFCGGWIPRPIGDDEFQSCVCGYYAYWDGSDDYKAAIDKYEISPTKTVTGVIQAFGRVVVGSRGFRASKARVVALVVPSDMVLDKGYNTIPQFKTLEAMLSEFPLTKMKGKDEDK